MEGSLLQIESSEINKKRKAAEFIFISLLKYNEYSKSRKYFSNLTVLILVPNGKEKIKNFLGLVSIIIGAKGKQINYLIKDSRAKIIVNQPVYKMMQRSIIISGKKIINGIRPSL
jgi:hypothetical protein